MLDSDELAEERALILRTAEGNPFYVQEVVKSLQEVGAVQRIGERYELSRRLDEVQIPTTIHDVIMARIDLLKAADKATKAYANREAIAFYDQALDIAGALVPPVSPAAVIELHQAKAALYLQLSDFPKRMARRSRR
jgi:predicted ATPase